MDSSYLELQLPGFRFHPTEEELLEFYLKNMVLKKNAHHDIIGYLDIYRYDPWDLPKLSSIGEREWYFFVPRDRKHGSGGRPNRTTENGFWKATGSDRKIFGLSDPKKHLGLKKTLVFYKGRAPRGSKTDWVMNEYRLPDSYSFGKEIVLCKIYRKATSMKVLEQRAALEEDTKTLKVSSPLSPEETASFYTQSDYVASLMPSLATPTESCHMASEYDECHQDLLLMLDENLKEESSPPHAPSVESCQMALKTNDALCHDLFHMLDEDVKQEPDIVIDATNSICDSNNNNIVNMVTSLKLPIETESLHVLQLPKTNMDWTQDAFWRQLCSPWLLDNIMLTSPYANVLNF